MDTAELPHERLMAIHKVNRTRVKPWVNQGTESHTRACVTFSTTEIHMKSYRDVLSDGAVFRTDRGGSRRHRSPIEEDIRFRLE